MHLLASSSRCCCFRFSEHVRFLVPCTRAVTHPSRRPLVFAGLPTHWPVAKPAATQDKKGPFVRDLDRAAFRWRQPVVGSDRHGVDFVTTALSVSCHGTCCLKSHFEDVQRQCDNVVRSSCIDKARMLQKTPIYMYILLICKLAKSWPSWRCCCPIHTTRHRYGRRSCVWRST